MIRIAVISDVHANILGLEAVIQDARACGADAMAFLGDLVMSGPRPAEVMARMSELNPSIWIKGNTDDWPREVDEGFQPSSPVEERIKSMTLWTMGRLPQEEYRSVLKRPVFQSEVYSGQTVVFCHGTPDSYSKGILPGISGTDLELLTTHASLPPGSVLVCGHTHHRFMLRTAGLDIVNFGAVSIPGDDESRCARYGLLEIVEGRIAYRPRDVEYDVDAYIQDMIELEMPGKEEVLKKYQMMSEQTAPVRPGPDS